MLSSSCPPPSSLFSAYSASVSVAMLGGQVRRREHAGLFVAAERDDQVARRHEALALQAQERGRESGDALLVVERAAAEEVAVLLDQRERIALPFLRLRGDDVHVGEQQDRFAAATVAAIAHDQRGGLADRQDVDVLLGETRRPEAFGQILRHRRHLAEAFGSAERDDLLKDLARLLADFLRCRVFGECAGGA